MNVALRLLAEGLDVDMLTRVGRDPLGDELTRFLDEQGLSTRFVQIDERQPTGTVLVDTSNPAAARYDICEPVAWDFIDAERFLEEAGNSPDTLVFGSLAARNDTSRQALTRLLDLARLKVFDVNLRPPFTDRSTIEMLLRGADWVKVNDAELELIAGWHQPCESIESAANLLRQKYGVESICITLGDDGAVLLYRDEFYRQPAFEVDVVDTVGCGDAFLGAWLSNMLRGVEPQQALRRAAAIGALVAASEGANPRISEDAVTALVNS
jgi:fructokinase